MNVVITGASKGFGMAIAEIFAAHGHNLFICARNEIALYKAMEELLTRYTAVQATTETSPVYTSNDVEGQGVTV